MDIAKVAGSNPTTVHLFYYRTSVPFEIIVGKTPMAN